MVLSYLHIQVGQLSTLIFGSMVALINEGREKRGREAVKEGKKQGRMEEGKERRREVEAG